MGKDRVSGLKQSSESGMRTVPCAQGSISYTLIRKSVKNINLRVKRDGRILVSANPRVPVKYIDSFVESKQDFILKALKQYAESERQKIPEPVNYEAGEQIRLLGKVYTIRVESSLKEGVFPEGEELVIRVKNPSATRHRVLLVQKWLKGYQTQIFEEIVQEVYDEMRQHGVPYPQIKVRSMKTRWGSCQPVRGIITLNSQLIKMPPESIEYVVLHEFAHFVHPDHSKHFWNLVAAHMPDWKERRRQLKMWE